jgi:Pentapeptide repeats (9 copies)
LTILCATAAVLQATPEVMSPVELWVGETADLTRQFPDEEKDKRKLSAHFLEDLLTGGLPGFKPHRNGVRIVGAIIDEPIDLTNAQIPAEVRLEHCQFTSSANFTRASFAGLASFDGTAFNADATFHHVKTGDSIFLRKTTKQWRKYTPSSTRRWQSFLIWSKRST